MKNLKTTIITGIIFVSVLGTILHFTFNWSGNNMLIGIFSATNESVWEHMKLFFFPMIIFSLYAKKALSAKYPCINSATAFGTLLGTFLIPVLFYTYSGILGFNSSIIDILIFYISTLAAFYFVYHLARSCKMEEYKNLMNLLLLIITAAFIVFTFFPPNIALFQSP